MCYHNYVKTILRKYYLSYFRILAGGVFDNVTLSNKIQPIVWGRKFSLLFGQSKGIPHIPLLHP